jgi:hypothetical protein
MDKKWEMLVHKYADHSHHKHEESLLVTVGEKVLSGILQT